MISAIGGSTKGPEAAAMLKPLGAGLLFLALALQPINWSDIQLSWFNFHPLFMALGFIVMSGLGTIMYVERGKHSSSISSRAGGTFVLFINW